MYEEKADFLSEKTLKTWLRVTVELVQRPRANVRKCKCHLELSKAP